MLYASYGSNCNVSQMAYRCPKSKIVCNGKINGYKLVFNIHADVIKTDNENDFVPVVLWNIDKEDWYRLDRYEGYPNYYIKKIIDVELDNGKIEKAIVYVMTENRKGVNPPERSYFDCIIRGYIANNIDTEYLYNALTHSYAYTTKYNQYKTKELV